jgi:serine kinase of HPr protein (carbohydrate metabolism regulator)
MKDTVHGTALIADGTGILILGVSGSGKSELALDLIDQCHMRGKPAMLIGDDRLVIENGPQGVFACVPDTIAGLVEVRGSGIHRIDHQARGRIDLAIRLVEAEKALRMAEKSPVEVLPGIILPCLDLPQRSFSATRAVLVRLGLYGGVHKPIS